MELADAGYAERTARNVADSDVMLVISNGVPLGGTGETVDRCIEMRKPHLIIDCARRTVQETIEVATEFVTNLSFRVSQTRRNLSNARKSPGAWEDPSRSLGMTIVLNASVPQASRWPAALKTSTRLAS